MKRMLGRCDSAPAASSADRGESSPAMKKIAVTLRRFVILPPMSEARGGATMLFGLFRERLGLIGHRKEERPSLRAVVGLELGDDTEIEQECAFRQERTSICPHAKYVILT